MAQLLGVLGLNSKETKLRMAQEGVVKCLVDILIRGGQTSIQTKNEENLSHVALVQEASAAALATVILHCRENAIATVEAGAISHLVKLLDPITQNYDKMSNFKSEDLLPSTYKSLRSEICFPIDITTTSNSNFKLDFEFSGAKKNTSISNEDLVEVGSLVGGSLAAMAALGNIISCYPQCWREIVDAGVAPKLANLLKRGICVNNGEQNNKVHELQDCSVPLTKVQESAALVLDLLIDCEKNNSTP